MARDLSEVLLQHLGEHVYHAVDSEKSKVAAVHYITLNLKRKMPKHFGHFTDTLKFSHK